jgi:DNA-binding PadR family transcriptional regulator
VKTTPRFSRQTLAVLQALARGVGVWQHGYALAQLTGLKSGSLYPILIRLTERGLAEAEWEAEQPAGRPRRHHYRITAEGQRVALATASVRPAQDTRRTSVWEPIGGHE